MSESKTVTAQSKTIVIGKDGQIDIERTMALNDPEALDRLAEAAQRIAAAVEQVAEVLIENMDQIIEKLEPIARMFGEDDDE